MNTPTPAEHSDNDSGCWETPPNVFNALHNEFNFDVDLTAGPGTQHRLPVWFGPGSPYLVEGVPAVDALTIPWKASNISCGFSNPRYGTFIPKILNKAIEESYKGFTTVFLLPNRVNKWYKRAMREATEIRIVDERIAFWEDGHPRWNAKILREEQRQVADPAMFDSCLVLIQPPLIYPTMFPRTTFDLWHWDPARLQQCRLSIPLLR